jgi:hypothetical protein
MRTRTLLATAALSLVTSGCLPSTIQLSCADIAQAQCAACARCVDELDQSGVPADERIDLGDLCGVSADACEARLEQQCIDQASGRQDANAELDACFEQLEAADPADQCADLYEGWALDRPATSAQCRRFL